MIRNLYYCHKCGKTTSDALVYSFQPALHGQLGNKDCMGILEWIGSEGKSEYENTGY